MQAAKLGAPKWASDRVLPCSRSCRSSRTLLSGSMSHHYFRRCGGGPPALSVRATADNKIGPVVRYTNARILRNHRLEDGDLWVCDSEIIDPQPLFFSGRQADKTVDCQGRILAPGFIDLQLNGAFGADFCRAGPELEAGVRLAAQRILEYGVTAFLPTVITSSPESYRAILPKLVPTPGSASGAAVLGVHLEGPFISNDKPGCHPCEHITPLDGQPNALRRACGGYTAHVKLVTLAPELPGAMSLISELVADGVVVSVGHSTATAAQMEAAQAAGARMVTHLFNAMPAFHPLEPGIIGLLGSTVTPRPFFGLIADGVHVHPASVKMAHSARPESVVLVSDAMMAMGLPDGIYHFGDVGEVELVGGQAFRAGTTTLAGAVVPLDECMRRFRRFTGCSLVAALEAASLHPAQALGIATRKGTLDAGADADFVMLDDELNVLRCYVAGEQAWPPLDAPVARRTMLDAAVVPDSVVPSSVPAAALPATPNGIGNAPKRRRVAPHS